MKRKNLLLLAAFAVLIAIVVLVPKNGGKGGMPGAPGGAPGAGGAPAAGKPAAGKSDAGKSGNAPAAGKSEAGKSGGAPAAGGGKSGGAPGAGAWGKAPATTYRITSVVAERTTLHDYLEINGDVEADDIVAAFPDTSGKLVRINARLGSKVSKGDVIAEVDPSKPGVSYSLSPVYAPISGTVTSMPTKVGSTVSPSTAIASIGDIGNLQVSAKIPEREIASLRNGLKAEITFEAYPGVVFGASVFSVSPVVDSTSRTKEIFLSFDSDDERINAGMFAKIKLYTTTYRDSIVIPEEAVVENDDKRYVYVVGSDNVVKKTPVAVGASVDGDCIILEGLSGGERVAYEGVTVLSDGVTVRDISQKSAEPAALDGKPGAAPDGKPGEAPAGKHGAAPAGKAPAGKAPAGGAQ